jgi:hypothetical protein
MEIVCEIHKIGIGISEKNRTQGRKFAFVLGSDPGRIQTFNLLIRSQMLYSVKLRGHSRAANIAQKPDWEKIGKAQLKSLNWIKRRRLIQFDFNMPQFFNV